MQQTQQQQLNLQRFFEITGYALTPEMKKQFCDYADDDMGECLDRLDINVNQKRIKPNHPFGYLCGMLKKYEAEVIALNNNPRRPMSPEEFSKVCKGMADQLESFPVKVGPMTEIKEPQGYTDRQVMILYLLLNSSSFSTHYKAACDKGYVLPALPRYMATLTDFSKTRFLKSNQQFVDSCFKEAEKLNRETPEDFHQKLSQYLSQCTIDQLY